jgi:hypothetical protein
MDSKSLTGIQIKDETKGEVEAVFATLNVKDSDDDVTLPGAFNNGAKVAISAYGHKSWDGALPVGKGTIHEVGDQVVMKGQFFMNTQHGRETFETVKALAEDGIGEWSYGFKVDDSEPGEYEGKSVRMLKKMSVFEVSPVMRGAGVGTRTTYAKGEKMTLAEEISLAVDAVKGATESARRVVALRAEKGKELSNVVRKGLEDLDAALLEVTALLADEVDSKSDDGSDELRKLWLRSIASNYPEGE